MADNHSLSHSKWNCKYHIVFAPKYRRNVIYGQIKADIRRYLPDCPRKPPISVWRSTKAESAIMGACEIAVPRDRNGEFEPKVIEKRQTRTDEIEQIIMQMYAKGMSQRDIEDTLKQIYGNSA